MGLRSARTPAGSTSDDKDGVALYSRTRLGTALKEFKGHRRDRRLARRQSRRCSQDVAATRASCLTSTESRVVSRRWQRGRNLSAAECALRRQSRLHRPRRARHRRSAQTATLIYRDTWQTANDAGPAERRGVVRVKVNEGSWLLEPAGRTGGSTQATYQIYTDSGGVLPAFLANEASQFDHPKALRGDSQAGPGPEVPALA